MRLPRRALLVVPAAALCLAPLASGAVAAEDGTPSPSASEAADSGSASADEADSSASPSAAEDDAAEDDADEDEDTSGGTSEEDTPEGGVDAGDGSTAGLESPLLFGLAAVTAAGAVGAVVYRRRLGGAEN